MSSPDREGDTRALRFDWVIHEKSSVTGRAQDGVTSCEVGILTEIQWKKETEAQPRWKQIDFIGVSASITSIPWGSINQTY